MKRRNWGDLLAWVGAAVVLALVGGGFWLALLAWSGWRARP